MGSGAVSKGCLSGKAVAEVLKAPAQRRIGDLLGDQPQLGMVMGNLAAASHGACVVLPPGFDPEATLRAVQEERCTSLYGVPTMFIAELTMAAEYDLSSLRTGIMAGDDPGAKSRAAQLIDRLGFDTVDAGALADSWRFEPESGAYTQIYLANPDVPVEHILQASAAPLPAARLRAALQASRRVKVAERAF